MVIIRILFHELFETSLIDSLGFCLVHWKDYAKYQTMLVTWGEMILYHPSVNVSPDNFVIRKAKRGRFTLLYSHSRKY
jgi:hypothetical protein